MKYKVGDVVKLKSKKELEKVGWSTYYATELEGAKLNILGVVHDLYITVQDEREYHFGDDAVKELVSESEKDDTYTFEELKSEVEKFREYLLNAGNKNGCCIDVSFSSTKYEGLNTVANVKSDISIKFNGITIETDSNMETKEMKIVAPDGYEIDKENSTLECIKFKPIKNKLTYEDVAKELFCDNECYYIDQYANINQCSVGVTEYVSKNPINCTSKKQAEKLLAINKLMNVAKYLNGDWKPNWDNAKEAKYCIYYYNGKYTNIGVNTTYIYNLVYFKTEGLAQQAIEILGEETIKLALSTDW